MDMTQLLQSSLFGVVRGTIVDSVLQPLKVVKIQQQCSSQSTLQIVQKLLQEDGHRPFFRGLTPQLTKTTLKQVWVWPMITGLPPLFHTYGFRDTSQQILTGLSIAVVDASITTPIERRITHLALGINKPLLAWEGFTPLLAKRATNMSVFLLTQKHFREQKGELGLSDLIVIGVKVGLCVGCVSFPLDHAKTLRQAHGLKLSQMFTRERLSSLWRGGALYITTLIVHNVASVIAIDQLSA